MMNLRNMVIGLASDQVALQLIQHWEYDAGTLAFWRASSNFVYTFERESERYFLRFSDQQDHTHLQIEAELEFIQYLRKQMYPSVEPVSSVNGRLIETVQLNGHEYYGVVFRKAAGVPLDMEIMSDDHFFQWGQSLAELHSHAAAFKPASAKRYHWQDVLHTVRSILHQHPEEHEALAELRQMVTWLETLPCTTDNFGLIHYDFQTDNVHWDESSKQFHVFDFDDAHYHWFAMDIVAALVDLLEQDTQTSRVKIDQFLTGYKSIRALDDELIGQFPLFLRFSRLYTFARILRSLENSDMDPPEVTDWYEGLKHKLVASNTNKRLQFGNAWPSHLIKE